MISVMGRTKLLRWFSLSKCTAVCTNWYIHSVWINAHHHIYVSICSFFQFILNSEISLYDAIIFPSCGIFRMGFLNAIYKLNWIQFQIVPRFHIAHRWSDVWTSCRYNQWRPKSWIKLKIKWLTKDERKCYVHEHTQAKEIKKI